MCMICEMQLDRIRHAAEYRTAQMACALVKNCIASSMGNAPHDHTEETLINQGFSRVEIKDFGAQALIMLAELCRQNIVKIKGVNS